MAGAYQLSYEDLMEFAYLVDGVATSLVLSCAAPALRRVAGGYVPLLSTAISLFIISNFIYVANFINISYFISIYPETGEQVASDNKSEGDAELIEDEEGDAELIEDEDIAFWMGRLAVFFVFLCWASGHEFSRSCFWLFAVSLMVFSKVFYFLRYLRPQQSLVEENTEQHQETELDSSSKASEEKVDDKDEMINTIDEENSKLQRANLGFRLKESKQEKKAQDERKRTGEVTTGQHTAKLEVSVLESKEEVTSSSEKYQSMEAKYLAKMEKVVDILTKNFEEERSQLMYELGASRASVEIYRGFLHDLQYRQPQ